MKRIFCFLIVAVLLLSGCLANTKTPNSSWERSSSLEREKASIVDVNPTEQHFIVRQENELWLSGQTVQLQAINFDNLTWYQEMHLDGTPVFLFHHTEADYDQIQSLGFNTIRYFVRWQDLFTDPNTFEKQEEGWKWLDQNISWAKERGMFLILDFHCPYGAFGTPGDGTWPIWTDAAVQNSFVQMWQIIAEVYGNETSIAAYDLMNEPSLPVDGKKDYEELMETVISAIREKDVNHVLIVEAAVGIERDEASYSRPTWVKVSDENVMYSFHFYKPIYFSHQTEETSSDEQLYPNEDFSQEDLSIAFKKFTDDAFLNSYPILLGEFGCDDWNEGVGSEQWITDVYRLCSERNIHTALFAYRSFEDISEKDEYSFAISRLYLQANTESGTQEDENKKLLTLLPALLNQG